MTLLADQVILGLAVRDGTTILTGKRRWIKGNLLAHRHRRRTGRQRKKPSPDREESEPSRRAYHLHASLGGGCRSLW